MAIQTLPNGACSQGKEKEKLISLYEEVKNLKLMDIATDIEKKTSWGQHVFTGVLKDEYRDIDLIKLAIICDCGYWFFGGESCIDRETGKIKVTIWFD
jgi:hypothetical protein